MVGQLPFGLVGHQNHFCVALSDLKIVENHSSSRVVLKSDNGLVDVNCSSVEVLKKVVELNHRTHNLNVVIVPLDVGNGEGRPRQDRLCRRH